MESFPVRYSYWNIPVSLRVVFFGTMAIAVAFLCYGTVQRVRLWRKGQPEIGFDRPRRRIGRVLRYAVAQVRILRQGYPAAMHLGIFWGMTLLFIGTVLATLDTDLFELILDAKLLQGDFYLLYKVVLDLAGLFVLIGLGLAIYRRYVVRPDYLNTDWRFHLTLPLLALIILTGLLVEALRLAAMQPPWAPFSVIAYPISLLLQGLSESTLLVVHRSLWVGHFLVVAAGIAAVPWTNLFHIVSSPANVFVAPWRSRGALRPIDNLEQAETLGVSKLAEFPWPRLINMDACTECGRCQAVCPAHAARQPLSPKQLVLDLRAVLPALGRQGHSGTTDKPAEAVRTSAPHQLVGEVIQHETLWSCTTCYACVYECPVLIEHVDDIIDMRRYLALAEGDLPGSLASTLTNIERAGNPWKQPKRRRAAWAQGLGFEVPVMRDRGEADVLWWVGCAGAYDPRNQKVTRAIARILSAAGVDFAILGDEETCTGDAARRAGNEYLFQTLAQSNIQTLRQYKFRVILTQCPHCLNTLKNEYPQFGGAYNVVHYTEYIEQLLRAGRVGVSVGDGTRLAFHDPCYLGRYNDIYDAPRALIAAAGMKLTELQRSRDRAMCCGGGGARVWMEDEGEVRVNRNRLAQIRETGAQQIGVACPFCLIMLEDARSAVGAEDLVIRDVAELVADALAVESRPAAS
jgi:Fe-S oxidoreductase/nitrate reductase gamma subunit